MRQTAKQIEGWREAMREHIPRVSWAAWDALCDMALAAVSREWFEDTVPEDGTYIVETAEGEVIPAELSTSVKGNGAPWHVWWRLGPNKRATGECKVVRWRRLPPRLTTRPIVETPIRDLTGFKTPP